DSVRLESPSQNPESAESLAVKKSDESITESAQHREPSQTKKVQSPLPTQSEIAAKKAILQQKKVANDQALREQEIALETVQRENSRILLHQELDKMRKIKESRPKIYRFEEMREASAKNTETTLAISRNARELQNLLTQKEALQVHLNLANQWNEISLAFRSAAEILNQDIPGGVLPSPDKGFARDQQGLISYPARPHQFYQNLQTELMLARLQTLSTQSIKDTLQRQYSEKLLQLERLTQSPALRKQQPSNQLSEIDPLLQKKIIANRQYAEKLQDTALHLEESIRFMQYAENLQDPTLHSEEFIRFMKKGLGEVRDKILSKLKEELNQLEEKREKTDSKLNRLLETLSPLTRSLGKPADFVDLVQAYPIQMNQFQTLQLKNVLLKQHENRQVALDALKTLITKPDTKVINRLAEGLQMQLVQQQKYHQVIESQITALETQRFSLEQATAILNSTDTLFSLNLRNIQKELIDIAKLMHTKKNYTSIASRLRNSIERENDMLNELLSKQKRLVESLLPKIKRLQDTIELIDQASLRLLEEKRTNPDEDSLTTATSEKRFNEELSGYLSLSERTDLSEYLNSLNLQQDPSLIKQAIQEYGLVENLQSQIASLKKVQKTLQFKTQFNESQAFSLSDDLQSMITTTTKALNDLEKSSASAVANSVIAQLEGASKVVSPTAIKEYKLSIQLAHEELSKFLATINNSIEKLQFNRQNDIQIAQIKSTVESMQQIQSEQVESAVHNAQQWKQIHSASAFVPNVGYLPIANTPHNHTPADGAIPSAKQRPIQSNKLQELKAQKELSLAYSETVKYEIATIKEELDKLNQRLALDLQWRVTAAESSGSALAELQKGKFIQQLFDNLLAQDQLDSYRLSDVELLAREVTQLSGLVKQRINAERTSSERILEVSQAVFRTLLQKKRTIDKAKQDLGQQANQGTSKSEIESMAIKNNEAMVNDEMDFLRTMHEEFYSTFDDQWLQGITEAYSTLSDMNLKRELLRSDLATQQETDEKLLQKISDVEQQIEALGISEIPALDKLELARTSLSMERFELVKNINQTVSQITKLDKDIRQLNQVSEATQKLLHIFFLEHSHLRKVDYFWFSSMRRMASRESKKQRNLAKESTVVDQKIAKLKQIDEELQKLSPVSTDEYVFLSNEDLGEKIESIERKLGVEAEDQQTSPSQSKIQQLEQTIAGIKRELEKINAQRVELSTEIEELQQAIAAANALELEPLTDIPFTISSSNKESLTPPKVAVKTTDATSVLESISQKRFILHDLRAVSQRATRDDQARPPEAPAAKAPKQEPAAESLTSSLVQTGSLSRLGGAGDGEGSNKPQIDLTASHQQDRRPVTSSSSSSDSGSPNSPPNPLSKQSSHSPSSE
ncbi:MAG: hypothetical protein J0649_01600, partial [Methylococcales bacterium]|nr:hypothetical protein [Methylococcales bacterium]